MESLQLNKADIKYLLIVIAFLPICSFIGGVSFANLLHTPTQESASPVPQARELVLEEPFSAGLREVAYSELIPEASMHAGDVERTASDKPFVVQAGLFSNRQNALNMLEQLEAQALASQIVREVRDDTTLYRVVLSAFASEDRAQAYAKKVRKSHQLALYVTQSSSAAPLNTVAAL